MRQQLHFGRCLALDEADDLFLNAAQLIGFVAPTALFGVGCARVKDVHEGVVDAPHVIGDGFAAVGRGQDSVEGGLRFL